MTRRGLARLTALLIALPAALFLFAKLVIYPPSPAGSLLHLAEYELQ